ncbi:MAG: hypothetical protein KC417_16735 [Myxococcales bacterium]|nr:hypothetical protein [Myxococcales bacterium]
MRDREDTAIHDQPTVVRSRDSIFGKATVKRSAAQANDPHAAWLASLPVAARAVLEAARRQAPSWPLAARVEGAIAEPKRKVRPLFGAAPTAIPATGHGAERG